MHVYVCVYRAMSALTARLKEYRTLSGSRTHTFCPDGVVTHHY